MSRKVTQDDLDALETKFNDKIVRVTGMCGLTDTIIESIKEDIQLLQPTHNELKTKDEIILRVSKEMESLSTERIKLQTRIVKLKKEIEEKDETIEKLREKVE